MPGLRASLGTEATCQNTSREEVAVLPRQTCILCEVQIPRSHFIRNGHMVGPKLTAATWEVFLHPRMENKVP